MQGLVFFLCVCEREREFDLDGKTILSFFIFGKCKPQRILIFKEHLYQRQIAVFQSTATCSSFCSLREGMLA